MIVTYDQSAALTQIMRDNDAHEASVVESGWRTAVFQLYRDDVEKPVADGSISVAGLVRMSEVA